VLPPYFAFGFFACYNISMNSKIISFAIEAHHNTNHLYDNKPYSVHLSMVVMYAIRHFKGACLPADLFDTIIHACWLHDTIEDCRLTYNDIKAVAGEEVAEIVYAVSNEKGKNRKQRANETYYKGIRDTPGAIYVKLCDRLANIKYSSDTNSRMLNVYRDENEAFLNALLCNNDGFSQYNPMVKELHKLLAIAQPDL
jgi:(p)ppGpp synthase/HD superfamily hydrolase